jgi:hypothetical protein
VQELLGENCILGAGGSQKYLHLETSLYSQPPLGPQHSLLDSHHLWGMTASQDVLGSSWPKHSCYWLVSTASAW